MQYKQDKVNLVIAGAWNHSIFSKEWVSKYLLDGGEIVTNIELPVLEGAPLIMLGESFKFSTKELSIQSMDNRFRIIAIEISDDVLNKIDEIAIKIAEYLPHTPVMAFGFNTGFTTKENDQIKQWFSCGDEVDCLKNNGYTLSDEKIVKKYVAEDYELNLTIEKNGEDCDILMNYHFNVKSLIDLKRIVSEKHFVHFKQHSLDVLESLFKLDLN